MLRANGGKMPQNIRGISSTGVTFGPEQHIPQQLIGALDNAVYAAAKAPTSGIFNRGPSAESQALDTAISSIMAYIPDSASIAHFADVAASTPEYANLPWDEILRQSGEDDLTPEEQLLFRSLLQSKRGFQ
jgi:hypothetical protein